MDLSEVNKLIYKTREIAELADCSGIAETRLWEQVILEHIRKATPVKPMADMWFVCPNCNNEDDYWNLEGFEESGDGEVLYWKGPSYCRYCGQSLDLEFLNKEGDSTTHGTNDQELLRQAVIQKCYDKLKRGLSYAEDIEDDGDYSEALDTLIELAKRI